VLTGVKVLAVSEDHAVRNLIESSFEAEGHQALCVTSSGEAIEALNRGPVWNLLLLDAAKQGCRGELFSRPLLERVGSGKICVLSEIGDTSWKSHARSWNINNVLTKPLLRQDLQKLISGCGISEAGFESLPLSIRKENSSYHLEELDGNGFFLAGCPAMIQMHKNIRILASVDYPVLILGESGVGKEIVARLLHKYHALPDKKFINVNTAAIPSELLESELFGYEVGAFTGAVKAKPGKFELADKGTLLLDEIGEMSPQMQAKLLHVLQDGSFTRLGGRSSTHVDVRILAATNVNLEAAIAEKRFREDLYYRLNAFTILVPSLRERREEIPALIEQMTLRGAASIGQEPFTFSNRLIEAAQEYHWPGNLRELRNFVIRLLVLQDQEAAYEDLRAKTRAKSVHAGSGMYIGTPDHGTSSQVGMKGAVKDVKYQTESRMIKQALSASGWNRRRAASNLNISYRTLLYKIQQHGLSA
jgi:two-component system, NtrC family, response regulator AtoC